MYNFDKFKKKIDKPNFKIDWKKYEKFSLFVFGQIVLINTFGVLYSLMEDDFEFKDPIDPFYYSVITHTSIGYGDFGPKTRRAKILVMIHSIISLIMYAELIVVIYTKSTKKKK